MRRLITAAMVAVFLSVGLQGCYTKLKGPEPGTGEKEYHDYDYYRDYYDFYDYYGPYFFHWGWYSPFLFGYPSYYGNFYSPWWYDPYYYYYDGGRYYDGRTPSGKIPRGRSGTGGDNMPAVPSGGYVPPATGGDHGRGVQSPPPSVTPPSNNNPPPREEPKSGGKTTRGR